jgi:hypothetical protein
MSVYGHVAVGAALGTLASHPVAALALGVAAHVPADLVSHHDLSRRVELFMAAAALILYTWLGGFALATVLGAVGGALPDVENLLRPRRHGVVKMYFPPHAGLLRHGDARGRWDVLGQLGVAAVMAAWVVWARALY